MSSARCAQCQRFLQCADGAGWEQQGEAAPGTLPWKGASSGAMAPVVPEAALYAQLCHLHRLLDGSRALARLSDAGGRAEAAAKLAPARAALVAGAAAVGALRERCAYRWVDLGGLFSVIAASGD